MVGLEQLFPEEHLQRFLAAAMQLPASAGPWHSPQHRMALVDLLLQMHREQEAAVAVAGSGPVPGAVVPAPGAAGPGLSAGSGPEMSLPLALAHQLVGEMEYEDLYEFFGPSRPPSGGVPECVLSMLPLQRLSCDDLGDGMGVGAKGCTSCPICLEPFQAGEFVRSLPCCNYTFHQECVDQWLRAKADCPLCRSLASAYDEKAAAAAAAAALHEAAAMSRAVR